MRVLTYSHDGYGLGHLRRNMRLAARLCERLPDATVLAATGSFAPHHLTFPPGVDYVKLPSIAKVANDRYDSRSLRLDAAQVIKIRSSILEATAQAFYPDLVIVDRYPLGIRGELRAALATIRSSAPRTRLVLGLRDILDDATTIREEWDRHRHAETATDIYDLVLFYGERSLYDAVAEYALPAALAEKCRFTGYLLDAQVKEPADRIRERAGATSRPLALCTVGGGEDGWPLASAFVEALGSLSAKGWKAVLVTGPYMPTHQVDRLRDLAARGPSIVMVEPFVSDLPSFINAADVVVSMGGYNTICEVMALGARCVVAPRTQPRTEQLIRASAFARRGLVCCLPPDELDPATLCDAILKQSTVPRHELRARIAESLRSDGLSQAVDAVLSTVRSREEAYR
jgi:predicted glycosyltransferase